MAWTLKKQYFASEIPQVKKFIESRWYEYTPTAQAITAWWVRDKKKLLDEASQSIVDNMKGDLVEKRQIDTTDLLNMKHTAVELLKARLNQITAQAKDYANYMNWMNEQRKIKAVDPKHKIVRNWIVPQEIRSWEIIDIITAVKRELWEPTTIVRNYNIHNLQPNLTDEEKALIDALDTTDALEVLEMGS